MINGTTLACYCRFWFVVNALICFIFCVIAAFLLISCLLFIYVIIILLQLYLFFYYLQLFGQI